MNYFDFFGLPISFQVDEATLRRQFLENSRRYHPDFHTLADDAHQAEMLERSTLNNEAYKTLADPDRRIRYVLELQGLLGEEGNQPPLPQDFLMEMMDINEALMDLEFDFDADRFAHVRDAVVTLEKEMDTAIQPILECYTNPGDPSDLLQVRDYFLKKRYLLRIQENLSKFAPQLEGN